MLYKTRKTISAEQWFSHKEGFGVMGTSATKICGCLMYDNPYNVYPHVHPAIGCSKLVNDGDYIIDLGKGFFDVINKEEFEKEYELIGCSKHELAPLTEEQIKDRWMSVGAYCVHCGVDLGWRCKQSPDGVCHYHSQGGKVWGINGEVMDLPLRHDVMYESDDFCIYCGHPDERK